MNTTGKSHAVPHLGDVHDTTIVYIRYIQRSICSIGHFYENGFKSIRHCPCGVHMLVLYGYGGDIQGLAEIAATPTPAPVFLRTTEVSALVVHGPIQNAVVCLDGSTNGVCDAGRPASKTDAAGKVTLRTDTADTGESPILTRTQHANLDC